jgi:Na+/H+ antiporter NhaD/arsenite permease-like protein
VITFIVIIFILGYVSITLEHSLKIDKLIPALLMMCLCWAAIALGIDSFSQWINPTTSKLIPNFTILQHLEKSKILEETLLHHFGKTAEILIFLMGAMVIIEMIDYFQGFDVIKKLIKTKSKRSLLWIIVILAFCLSAIIDNLTATIVLISILRKIVSDQKDRMWFAGLIVISANAGGAWTPIGDVTTTMLWMAGKVTSFNLMIRLSIPSIVNVLVPTIICTFLPAFKGNISSHSNDKKNNKFSLFMLLSGLILMIFVPIFKTITHLPPYIGMMLALAVFALIAELITKREMNLSKLDSTEPNPSLGSGPTMKALSKIEMPSILFFLGILMTVAALETIGVIFSIGQSVSAQLSPKAFVTLLGIASAVIDNIPLVAGSLGMFHEVIDANIWHYIAYAAGTGGSILIIGSAAGVVAMGMEKITFFWYLKNISILATLGYFAGLCVLMFC